MPKSVPVLTTIIPKLVLSENMPDLTVRDCVDYLRIVLTEFIQIATYKDKHIMLNEIKELKDYVNLINDTSISIGTILYLLVNRYMMLLFL